MLKKIKMKYVFFILASVVGSALSYPVTFGGKVYGGPRNNYPINACSQFDRSVMTFSGCDGSDAAALYCETRGYSTAQSFSLGPLENVGSSYVIGNQKIVEAGLVVDQQLLTDVTCV